MSPPLGGGKMIAEVSFDGFTPQPAPMASRPVRRMSPGLSASAPRWSGWRRAISAAENWSRSLASPAEEELAKRPGFRFRCQQSSLLAFEFEDIHHSDLVTLLAESGIALRAGQHCAQPLLAALGVSGTLRASFAPTIPKTMLRRWSTRWIAPGNSGGLMTTLHPFGTTITDATLRQIFAPLNQWEDKYRQLILLGKKLPTLTDERKAQAHEIAGCENRVWLGYEEDAEGRLHFFGDSEGRIVRGLLAVLLTAVEGKPAPGSRRRIRWRCSTSWGCAASSAPRAAVASAP